MNKTFLIATVILSFVISGAHANTHGATHDRHSAQHQNENSTIIINTGESEHENHYAHAKPQAIAVTIQNPDTHRTKRDVAMSKMIWALIKSGIGFPMLGTGITTTAFGVVSLPFSPGTGCAGCVVGPLIAYLGYKVAQSGANTQRDAFLESVGLIN